MSYLSISVDIDDNLFDDDQAAISFRDDLGERLTQIAELIGRDYNTTARIEHVE